MTYYHYWGKAQDGWHLLPYHSLDVAACANVLLSLRGEWMKRLCQMTDLNEQQIVRWTSYFAAIHDLGKFSSTFQGLVPDVAKELGQAEPFPTYDVRHDALGWALWNQSLCAEIREERSVQKRLNVWMRCATGHHGKPPSMRVGSRLINLKGNRYFSDQNLIDASEWTQDTFDLFQPDLTLGDEDDFEQASWWIAGLITLADWLGSNTRWFAYVTDEMPIDEYWNVTLQQAQVAVQESGLVPTEKRRLRFTDLFPDYAPTPMQQTADTLSGVGPSLVIIEDTTGSGKTEAALAASEDHFYFGLPTMATANGLWARISQEKVMEGHKTLIHGSRWLMPDAMNEATSWLNDDSRRALFAQMGVGTIDQALLAILYVRFSTLRLIALTEKTLIIDEVHAYDEYQKSLLKTLIQFQARLGSSVILLSATLPQSHRAEYVESWTQGRENLNGPSIQRQDYPLLTRVTDMGVEEIPVKSTQSRQVKINQVFSPDAVVREILSAVDKGFCVCWIRNTVNDAIESYDLLADQGLDVELFHARFTLADRSAIEAHVLERFGKNSTSEVRQGRVLVATQVVEQSLDLDFDLMISDLAPIDLLIQRAGRLHRHNRGERGEPVFIIHGPAWSDQPEKGWIKKWSSGTSFVYPDHGKLWLTLKQLRSIEYLHLPDNARTHIEGVYSTQAMELIPTELVEITEKQIRTEIKSIGQARLNTITLDNAYEADGVPRWDEESAPTRLGEPSQEWILTAENVPLHKGSAALSSLKIRQSMIDNVEIKPDLKLASWQKGMELTDDGNGGYYCNAYHKRTRNIIVRYDHRRGLSIQSL